MLGQNTPRTRIKNEEPLWTLDKVHVNEGIRLKIANNASPLTKTAGDMGSECMKGPFMHRMFSSAPPALFLFVIAVDPVLAAESQSDSLFDWRAFLAPFHTVTLHLPIGFVTMAVILEIYSLFRETAALRKVIGLVLWVSAVSAVIVTLLGLFRAADGGYETVALVRHQQAGIAVAVLTALLAIIHTFAYYGGSRKMIAALFFRLGLVINMVCLTIAGHYGGNLTHGSKYLTEGAPEWAREWIKKVEGSPETEPQQPGVGVFAEVIQPAFKNKCYSCHGPEKQKSEYRMDTKEGLFAAGESELDPIVAGNPLESYLVEMITLPKHDEFVMPPEGKEALTPEETLAVMRWIWDGAKL